jgi:hypothetical protein
MGRRKIRHFGSESYEVPEEESLIDAGYLARMRQCKIRDESRPKLGPGSGRAGGARSVAHKRDHIWRVGRGVKSESCPICFYGLEVWNLWIEGTWREAWCKHWECRESERTKCELFFAAYESERIAWWNSVPDSIDQASQENV